jgi:hypothetical protein
MKQFLVFLFLLCAASVSAQDVIVKKDGSTIVCRVVELTSSEITFKKWDNLNGSNYVMNRADASAINYQNGKKVNLSEATNLYQPHNQNDGAQQYNDKTLLYLDASSRAPLIKIKRLKATALIGGITMLAAGGILCALTSVEKKCLTIGIPIAGAGIIWTTSFLLAAHNAQKKFDIQSTSLYQYELSLRNGTKLMVGTDILKNNQAKQYSLGIGLRYNF